MKSSASPRRVLITGGAGFLGVNAAVHLIERGWHVTVLDNLSRGGTERNLHWLITQYPARTTFVKEDIRDASVLTEHVKNQEAPFVFASTNKVYGKLDHNSGPCKETTPLDFHSPYGCSKGTADQYVRDYARCFHMNTVVLRQSCIYGAHQ